MNHWHPETMVERSTPGVSLVVCCHNSASRIVPTLEHILAQEDYGEVPWEVVVIDNGSTDDTARVAQEVWPVSAPAPLRVVHEPRLGLNHARERGMREARYSIVSFLDDDNWVCADWVRRVADVMTAHPEVGACGGPAEAVLESPAPEWFARHQLVYAVGEQARVGGEAHLLWGAGLTVRRSAWEQLVANGFRPQLSDRQGTNLGGSGDTEITLALRMAGWKLWYEPGLRLRHFVPAGRLTWSYLRRKERGGGMASAGLDAYYAALKPPRRGLGLLLRAVRESWQWQALAVLARLGRRPGVMFRYLVSPVEGDDSILMVEGQLGRLGGLLRMRGGYARSRETIRNAAWRRSAGREAALAGQGSQSALAPRG